MAAPAPTAKTRTAYFIDIGNNKIVKVKALKTSIGEIAANLGYTEDADGNPPDGKILVGTSREDALTNGCFPIAVYYTKNKHERMAKLLVSPTKADTVATELKGKKYAGNPIVKVTPVRRRKFVY